MIIGIGIDVVGVERFAEVLARTPGVRQRLFTRVERDLPLESLAGRFAAKEALAKSLGSPPGMSWQDACITRGPHGAPCLQVRGTVETRAQELGVGGFHLSISHDAGVAAAVVIAQA